MAELLLSEEEQRQVEEGEAASFLLDNPAFLLAIDKVRKDCAEGILTSAPHNTEAREGLYNLSRGLSAITEQLLQMQALAVSVVENATRENLTEDDGVQDDGPDLEASY